MSRPYVTVTAELLATLTEMVPTRITKRLDAAPDAAERWTWATLDAAVEITTEGGERVTLVGPRLSDVGHVTCTCLLSPRCFHVLAVVSVLPLVEASAASVLTAGRAEVADEAGDDGAHETPSLDAAQRAAVARAGALGAAILAAGLVGVSTLRRGELVRAVHDARRHALPRLERALVAVLEETRALREKDPAFSARRASASMAELLWVTRRLSLNEVNAELIGLARQTYRTRANLLVTGLATEPVVRGGYAGVVSHFTDGTAVFSAPEIVPGDDDRAVAAITAQLRFGEVSLTHREVQASSLRFASARVTGEGRLGAGKDVVAARSPYAVDLVERWLDRPLATQLDTALAETVTGAGLMAVAGVLARPEAPVIVLTSGEEVALLPSIDHPRFAFRENLARLAAASMAVRLVTHVKVDGGLATFRPIAAFPLPGARHTLSTAMNLGFDKLRHAEVATRGAGGGAEPEERAAPRAHAAVVAAPLRALETRVFRMALAGARSLPGAAHSQVMSEARAMRTNLLPTLSAVLEALAPAAAKDPAVLAEAWLAAHVAMRAAERAFARASLGG